MAYASMACRWLSRFAGRRHASKESPVVGPDWCSVLSATLLECVAEAGHLLEAYACETRLLKLAFKGARAHFRVLAAQVWLKQPVDRFSQR